MAKAYIFARCSCGECKAPMALNEIKLTVRCPNMHCTQYNVEYTAPSVTLKKHVEKKPA